MNQLLKKAKLKIKNRLKTIKAAVDKRKLEAEFKKIVSAELNKESPYEWRKQLILNLMNPMATMPKSTSSMFNEKNQVFKLGCRVVDNIAILENLIGIQSTATSLERIYQIATSTDNNRIQIVSHVADAKANQFGTSLPVNERTGITEQDIELVAREMANEIIDNTVLALVELAKHNPKYDSTVVKSVDLGTAISQMSISIGGDIKRGMGNWVVVPSTIIDELYSHPKFRMNDNGNPTSENIHDSLVQVGTIFDGIRVFKSEILIDQVLVGFKSPNSNIDAGFLYAPFQIVNSLGTVIDANTFEPVLRFTTRAAIVYDHSSSSHEHLNFVPGESYFQVIQVAE